MHNKFFQNALTKAHEYFNIRIFYETHIAIWSIYTFVIYIQLYHTKKNQYTLQRTLSNECTCISNILLFVQYFLLLLTPDTFYDDGSKVYVCHSAMTRDVTIHLHAFQYPTDFFLILFASSRINHAIRVIQYVVCCTHFLSLCTTINQSNNK